MAIAWGRGTFAESRSQAGADLIEKASMARRWIEILETYHQAAHADDGWEMRVGLGASEEEIAAVESRLGCKFPPSLREFYRECNGYGLKSEKELSWFVRPVEEIEELTREARDWFEETHPEIARKFIAYVDWGSGDYSGGIVGANGVLSKAVCMFEHESYEYETDQDPDEFLSVVDESLVGFFDLDKERAGE